MSRSAMSIMVSRTLLRPKISASHSNSAIRLSINSLSLRFNSNSSSSPNSNVSESNPTTPPPPNTSTSTTTPNTTNLKITHYTTPVSNPRLLGRYNRHTPTQLFRLNHSGEAVTLRDYASQRRPGHKTTSYDVHLNKDDGLVHPTQGLHFNEPNGATMRPMGWRLQKMVKRARWNPAATISMIPRGTVLPDTLCVLHERDDHYSLQTTVPVELSVLNERMTDFLRANAQKMDVRAFRARYPDRTRGAGSGQKRPQVQPERVDSTTTSTEGTKLDDVAMDSPSTSPNIIIPPNAGVLLEGGILGVNVVGKKEEMDVPVSVTETIKAGEGDGEEEGEGGQKVQVLDLDLESKTAKVDVDPEGESHRDLEGSGSHEVKSGTGV
ncbi:hypothetical protein DFH27DRAFT_572948 [Peziza echinospora]|nr:hypothetical protein DFH27DRAFT_572948 [Peziza echinospora]